LDMYVEYTGTALSGILKKNPQQDPAAVYRVVKDEYEKQFNLRWLKPLGFNNTFAMIIRNQDAKKYNIQTISESARYTPQWTAGFGYEFLERQHAYPGFPAAYRLQFRQPPPVISLPPTHQAAASGPAAPPQPTP